jgi:UDP-GlcNAc:undecaprenyl-phosphate GlcNAc-1-phosphate transferase
VNLLLALDAPPGAEPRHLLYFGGALVFCFVLTALVKPIAIKADLVSRPRNDRWARTVIPLGGGVAMFLVIAAGFAVAHAYDLLLALTAIFLLGLADDRYRLSPPVKLVVQTGAACFLAFRGHLIPLGPDLVRVPLTVGWFVFMANSVNLLDNMDGSAAGVSAVAASFVYVIAAGGTNPSAGLASQAAVVAGAAGGFLLHNFPPASIFMGDAGSLLLGFALAGLSAKLPPNEGHVGRTLLAPALVLALPIFDTALVWAARRAAKRPFLLGGRDHTTHRLVALGLSERRTCLVLYGASALLGAAALAVARGSLGMAVLTALVVAAGLLTCGVFLVDVRVYKKAESPTGKIMTAETPRSAPNLWIFAVELAVDVAVISSAWVAAYVVKFAETDALDHYLNTSCLKALPFVIGLKLAAFLSQGLYRGFWRTVHVSDLFRIGRAVLLGSVLIVTAAAIADRLQDYSRAVFAVDAIFTFGGVVLSRTALRALRASVANLAVEPQRAILVGPRALVPLVESGLARDGKPPCKILAVVDPDAPEGQEQAQPALHRKPATEAAAIAESIEARVVLLAAPEAERSALERALSERGLTVLAVSVSVE